MADIGVDVFAEWRVVPEDVVTLSVFPFGSRDRFVMTTLFHGASFHPAHLTTALVKDVISV